MIYKPNKSQLIPTIFLLIFFSNNNLTVIKAILLGSAAFILSGKSFKKYLDLNFILLVIFFFIYFLISLYDGHSKVEYNNQLLIAPALLYLGGKWCGNNTLNPINSLKIYWLIGVTLASLGFLTVFADIIQNGFIGGSRNLVLPGSNNEISATVLGGMLIVPVSYAGVFFSKEKSFNFYQKLTVLIFFLLGLISAIRVGSRTILLICALSIIIGIFHNRKKYNFINLLLIFIPISILIYIIIIYLSDSFDIFNYYQDRIDSDENGLGSAGGRTERWVKSLSLMLEYPMGWGIDINGYSHNLWLDVARNGGIPTFIISVALTIRAFITFSKTLTRFSNNSLYTTSVLCAISSYLMLFFVEPIFDGFIYTFSCFCCLWGMVQGTLEKNIFSTESHRIKSTL